MSAAIRLAAVAAAALLAGCGAAAPAPTAAPQVTTTAEAATSTQAATSARVTASTQVTTTTQVTSASSAASTSRDLSEADNGSTVSLRAGGTLRVVLHSTYWQIDPASDSTVLASEGSPSYSPDPPGTCVPGGGCGTVTATFQALRPGRAVVSAHRTSCGEALRCTGNQGSYAVTVMVTG